MYIFWCNVMEIDPIDLCRDSLVFRHPGDGDDVLHLGVMLSFVLPDCLLCFKESWSSRNSHGFQGRGDCQADSLVGAGWIRHQQVCLQRIQSPVYTFDGGIVGLEVNTDISPVHSHHLCSAFPISSQYACRRFCRRLLMVRKSAVSIVSENLHFWHFT